SLLKKPALFGQKNRVFEFSIAILLAITALVTLLTALAAPIKFDALVYHLSLGQIFSAAGKIIYTPSNIFWGMPLLGEMIYLLAQLSAGLSSAVFVGWLVGVIGLVGIYGYTREKFGTGPGWVSIACLLSGFTLATSIGWGYVDWFAMLFGIAFIIALDLWHQSGSRKFIILVGVFTGFALGAKYTAGVLLVSGAVIILFMNPKKAITSRLLDLLLYILVAGAVFSPWLVKNLIATGNPIYPFLEPGGAMDQFRLDFYKGNELRRSWLDIVILPIRATMIGVEGALGYSASIGPLFLGLGAAAAWVNWKSRTLLQKTATQIAGATVLAGIIVWIIAGQFSGYLIQSRLYYAIFPAAAILAGAGYQVFENWEWKGVRFNRIVGALILLVTALNVYQISIDTISKNSLQEILGLQTRQEYIDNTLGWYGPAMEAITVLPDDASVLMLWETRSLYCLPKCDPDEIIDRWIHDRYLFVQPDRIHSSWKSDGYTHVLFHQAGADYIRRSDDRYSEADWDALEEVLAQLPDPVDFGGAYYLYSLE
ncbi:MAG: glycosyltransferase family 39 protein, partial [Anaerolineales bacterium]|nr:glycosyltransferase family 39 protein [Anaerolineales bacterium]